MHPAKKTTGTPAARKAAAYDVEPLQLDATIRRLAAELHLKLGRLEGLEPDDRNAVYVARAALAFLSETMAVFDPGLRPAMHDAHTAHMLQRARSAIDGRNAKHRRRGETVDRVNAALECTDPVNDLALRLAFLDPAFVQLTPAQIERELTRGGPIGEEGRKGIRHNLDAYAVAARLSKLVGLEPNADPSAFKKAWDRYAKK